MPKRFDKASPPSIDLSNGRCHWKPTKSNSSRKCRWQEKFQGGQCLFIEFPDRPSEDCHGRSFPTFRAAGFRAANWFVRNSLTLLNWETRISAEVNCFSRRWVNLVIRLSINLRSSEILVSCLLAWFKAGECAFKIDETGDGINHFIRNATDIGDGAAAPWWPCR